MESWLGRVVRVMELDAGVLDPTRHSGAWLSVQSLPLLIRDRWCNIKYVNCNPLLLNHHISDVGVCRNVNTNAQKA